MILIKFSSFWYAPMCLVLRGELIPSCFRESDIKSMLFVCLIGLDQNHSPSLFPSHRGGPKLGEVPGVRAELGKELWVPPVSSHPPLAAAINLSPPPKPMTDAFSVACKHLAEPHGFFGRPHGRCADESITSCVTPGAEERAPHGRQHAARQMLSVRRRCCWDPRMDEV